jgi:hypothetical protein
MQTRTIDLSELAALLATRTNGPRFIGVTYRAKGTGELARHTFLLGVNLANVYREDIRTLFAQRHQYAHGTLQRQAVREKVATLAKSLRVGLGNRDDYTCRDTFAPVEGQVKVHAALGTLFLGGLISHRKRVLEPGVYKAVKSSDKTLAKKEVSRGLRSEKIRTLALDNVVGARVRGDVVEVVLAG